MTELNLGDYITINHAMTASLVLALIAAGALVPSVFAAVCRRTAEDMEDDCARSHLLAFAEKMERAEAEADRLHAEGQDTPDQTNLARPPAADL